MSSRSPSPSSIAVVAILTDGDVSIDHTLEAVADQNYPPAGTNLVGADSKELATALGLGWHATVADLVASLGPTVTHVWMVRAGAVPRSDALRSLVFEAERVGADVAGSKLLDLDSSGRLVSVGLATDVFGVPYVGIEEDELDAGQYDVVRDVAAVDSASVLVRRDLLKGLGGPDPAMAPQAAAIDLSQRARVLGARVVVVPSSEVGVGEEIASPLWEEEAGRIRSMIKVYSPLTLVWALPLRFLIGLVEVLLAPFTGRWRLLTWVRSWLWNLVRLPSTLAARRTTQKAAAAGDAELFRFQLRGSAAMRFLWGELADAARARFPSEDVGGVAALAQEVRRPAFGVGVAAVLFSIVATRQLWDGFPAARFSLPLPASGADAVAAYAGGWNPAGFGSTQQLPPFLGLAGVWQQLWFDDPGLASGSLVLIAFVGGIWGLARLLRTWSVDTVPGILAGAALMAGPAARTLADSGDVANLVALGAVPWMMRVAVSPWPGSWPARVGRVFTASWLGVLLAHLSPDLILLPVAAVAVRAALNLRDRAMWRAVAIGAIGTVVGLALLRPWINNVDLHDYLAAGDAFWSPGVTLALATLLAALVATLFGPGSLWRDALWGSTVAAAGFILSRLASEGGGRHLEALGLAAVALGSAIAIGVMLDSLRRTGELGNVARTAMGVGALAAALVSLSAVLVMTPGRGGLPGDELNDALRFTGASIDDDSAARVLLIGDPESLPGTSRTVQGAAYRVVSAPLPELWEVELPPPGPADAALEAVLEGVIDGGSFRAGQQLAEFGIRWVVALTDTPLTSRFEGQLDLIPLDGLRRRAFVVDSVEAVTALASDGSAWAAAGTGYSGRPAESVLVREQANSGWGTDMDESDWAMTLDGRQGEVGFTPVEGSGGARASLLIGLAMAGASLVLRRRR